MCRILILNSQKCFIYDYRCICNKKLLFKYYISYISAFLEEGPKTLGGAFID